jgi:hypothetical protein
MRQMEFGGLHLRLIQNDEPFYQRSSSEWLIAQ